MMKRKNKYGTLKEKIVKLSNTEINVETLRNFGGSMWNFMFEEDVLLDEILPKKKIKRKNDIYYKL